MEYECFKKGNDITRPVGDIFISQDGIKIQVVLNESSPRSGNTCKDCIFHHVPAPCLDSKTYLANSRGECQGKNRSDGKNVIFTELRVMHIDFMEE